MDRLILNISLKDKKSNIKFKIEATYLDFFSLFLFFLFNVYV